MSERERQENMREEGQVSKRAVRTRVLGIALLVAAVLFWVASPGSAFLVLGEVAFWAAAVVLGREVFRRYRRLLDPRGWFTTKPR
jgi:hypothetical protein